MKQPLKTGVNEKRNASYKPGLKLFYYQKMMGKLKDSCIFILFASSNFRNHWGF